MKASELMCGDFVQVDGNMYRLGFVAKVAEVYKEAIFTTPGEYEGECVEEWYIQPIPLTPEILEKNGFIVKHPESEKRTYWRDATGQIVGHKNRGLMYMDITGNPERFGDFHPMFHGHIRFVHELQHALRLCGIEKEIVL